MVAIPARKVSAAWKQAPKQQDPTKSSHQASRLTHSLRTQRWRGSLSLSSVTQVPSARPLCHAQMSATSLSMSQKGCHNSKHHIPTQKSPTGQRKKCLLLSEREVFPRNPAQTSPSVPPSRIRSPRAPSPGEPGKSSIARFQLLA